MGAEPHYVDHEGKAVPRTTEALRLGDDGDGLSIWAGKAAIEAYWQLTQGGTPPSKTQVKAKNEAARKGFFVARSHAARVGDCLHAMIEEALRAAFEGRPPAPKLAKFLPKVIKEAEIGALNFVEWCKSIGGAPTPLVWKGEPFIERKLVSQSMGIGGTPDFFGTLPDGRVAILDWKPMKNLDKVGYSLQQGVYSGLIIEETGVVPDCAILVGLPRDEFPKFKTRTIETGELTQWRKAGTHIIRGSHVIRQIKENKR